MNIVKIRQYMLWRTVDRLQDVDKKCGHVDKCCGYLVRKVRINCEYLNYFGWKTEGKIFKARN